MKRFLFLLTLLLSPIFAHAYTIGYTALGASNLTGDGNAYSCQVVTTTLQGNCTGIWVNCTTGGSGAKMMNIGIYTNSSGNPGTLKAWTTGWTPVSANYQTDVWVSTNNIKGNVAMTANTPYWIAFAADAYTGASYDTGLAAGSRVDNGTHTNALPQTWTNASNGNYQFSIYLNIEETTPDPVVPPVNVFSGTVLSTGSIHWYWVDVSTETGYEVYSNADALLATLSANVTDYYEQGLSKGTQYIRYVKAVYDAYKSTASPTATVTTLTSPTTYWVDINAADDNGSGSQASPKKYITSGVSLLQGGDILIIKDGTYTGANARITNPPSGSGKDHTIIKAENDFGVTIDSVSVTTADNTSPIWINNKSSITIQGLLITNLNSSGSAYDVGAVVLATCTYSMLKNIGVRNGMSYHAQYNGGVTFSNCSYCLGEDIFVCGRMRYAITIVGGAVSNHNILRRGVVRWDYGRVDQPRSAIAVYGAGIGNPPCEYIELQNCIVLDANAGSAATNYEGGFSAPHETSHVNYNSCISLLQPRFGFFVAEDPLCHDNTINNCVIWETNGAAYWKNVDTNTVVAQGMYNCSISTGNVDGTAIFQTDFSSCIYTSDVNLGNMTDDVSEPATRSSWTFITASPLLTKGASIYYKMGADGTYWGQTGWNVTQSTLLWDFPNEDTIKTFFSVANPSDANFEPAINVSTRGFCNPGKQLDGSTNITLSSYIWEFRGTAYPFNPAAPTPSPTTPKNTIQILVPPYLLRQK